MSDKRTWKDEKILEQSYTIEALQDEIGYLKESLTSTVEEMQGQIEELEDLVRSKHERIWELIQENDRLTMTYEPYRAPGDENENTGYYDLIEEVNELRNQILEYRSETLKPKKIRKKYAGDIAFDIWPLSDWFRWSYSSWDPGKYWQLCIGPIRFEFFEIG